ncbi:MAG: SAM-dependent DNA methyltransferase [Patescibacteria group bacterium]|nr:SAM-dependent DNA methyltransferase [Patescibacteria group bacterium]
MTVRKSDDFRQILKRLAYGHDLRRVFDAFVRLAACAVAAQTREAEYLEEVKHWQKPELGLFAEALGSLVREMESEPFTDLIGGYYMEFALSSKGQQWGGEYHTPKPICDFMAQITMGDMSELPADRPITVCEPACGSGAMILSVGQVCSPEVRRRLRVTAIDINRTACDMAFLNTTLWGIPTRVIHGNTISGEYWSAWSNIHYIAPWLPYALRPQTPEAQEQGQPPKPVEIERIQASLQQQEFAL